MIKLNIIFYLLSNDLLARLFVVYNHSLTQVLGLQARTNILKAADLQSEQFNKMRSYLGAQISMMYANSLSSQPNGIEQLRQLVNALIV